MEFLALMAVTLGLAATSSNRDVVAEDSHGVTLAVMQGNSYQLQQIGKQTDAPRLAGRAGYYRTRGDLARSNRWADACITDPAVVAEKSQGLMYLCRSLRAGNRLLEGDIRGWANDMLLVRAIYLKHVAPFLPASQEVKALTVPAFDNFTSWPTRTTLQAPVTVGTVLTLTNTAGVPVIRGRIHGGVDGKTREIDSDFIIDTGSSRSHISRKAARAMGLSVTEGFATDHTNPEHPVDIGLAAPVNLDLGSIVLRDVSFTATDEITFNIIGLDLLQHLGPFVLRGNQLQLLQDIPTTICSDPLLTTSALWGTQYSMRLPMRIGNRDERVLLDTGTDITLEASGVDLATYPPEGLVRRQRWAMHGLQSVRYAEATAQVHFNGSTVTLPTQVSDQPATVFPISWRAGYGLSTTYDYYIDVTGARGCLSPSGSH